MRQVAVQDVRAAAAQPKGVGQQLGRAALGAEGQSAGVQKAQALEARHGRFLGPSARAGGVHRHADGGPGATLGLRQQGHRFGRPTEDGATEKVQHAH